jgi:uncharacterized oxidoreductase
MEVLITGGSEGIGRGLAARFLKAGHRVIITGRNKTKLNKLAAELPGLEIFAGDIGSVAEREVLAQHVERVIPNLEVLINNAGIQRRIPLAADQASWSERQAEIDILFSGPVHLNHLLIPLLLRPGKNSLIVNVTSGGAYIPQVFAPIYSASKAALHHYTLILRESLKSTPCKVIELVPPAVQTGLAGPGSNHGVNTEEFCDAVFDTLLKRELQEIGYGTTVNLQVSISGQPLQKLFEASAARFPVETYQA